MLRKNVLKRIIFGFMALVMAFTFIAPVFADETEEDLSRFEKTEYEDKYGKDGRIETIKKAGYDKSYKVTNEFPLESNVVVYLITQNLFYIDDSMFLYDFKGTTNAKNKYCDTAFTFDFGLLENKKINSKEELKCGETVNIRNYQFAVYSGFYNFYNYGTNGFWSQGNGETVIMKTFTPDFNLVQEDKYVDGKEAWVEVKPNDTVSIYVMIGTKDWYEKASKDIADWAMGIEKSIQNSNIEHAESNEEVEVTVDEEKLTEVLKDKEVVVETEEQTLPNFESTASQEVAEEKDYSSIIKYAIIAIVLAIVGVIGYKGYKKITKQY